MGFCPRLAPVFDWLVLRVLGLGCALPAVFCPWSCVSLPLVLGPFFVVFWLCWCFCLRFCGCFFRGRRAPLSVWWGFFAFVLCLAVVGSPPLPVVASPPLWLVPCGVLAQFLCWSLPLGICLLLVTAWLPCLPAGGVVVLCRPHFILSHGSKGLWPCVGFVLPSTP